MALQGTGVNAVGLSGCDGRLIEAKQKIITSVDESGKQKVIRDDYTGKIEKINGALLLIIAALLVFLFGLIADQISGLRLGLIRSQIHKNHNDSNK